MTSSAQYRPGINCPRINRHSKITSMGGLLITIFTVAALGLTGCQVDIAGQTLPSGYYLTDDVQYYAPDAEFKLSREAAALKEQSAGQISEPQR